MLNSIQPASTFEFFLTNKKLNFQTDIINYDEPKESNFEREALMCTGLQLLVNRSKRWNTHHHFDLLLFPSHWSSE